MGKRRRMDTRKKQALSSGLPWKPALAAAMVSLAVFAISGCEKTKEGEPSEVDFAVVTPEDIPQELLTIIEENKEKEMRLTWTDGEEMYLIRGDGKQATGGYSIGIAECTEDEDCLWFDTRLIGPQDEEALSKEPSWPYLVVKIAATQKEVIIE
ncbi:MAG: protease complex subunit PrcB family protein [Lachnospiraceae bacterium]|nr:protease complex subunit PrcB family protein [Lachnospiraceae bacterium]